MTQKSWSIEEICPRFVNAQMARGVTEKTIQTYYRHFRSLGHHLDMTMTFDELTKTSDNKLILYAKTLVNAYSQNLDEDEKDLLKLKFLTLLKGKS